MHKLVEIVAKENCIITSVDRLISIEPISEFHANVFVFDHEQKMIQQRTNVCAFLRYAFPIVFEVNHFIDFIQCFKCPLPSFTHYA